MVEAPTHVLCTRPAYDEAREIFRRETGMTKAELEGNFNDVMQWPNREPRSPRTTSLFKFLTEVARLREAVLKRALPRFSKSPRKPRSPRKQLRDTATAANTTGGTRSKAARALFH